MYDALMEASKRKGTRDLIHYLLEYYDNRIEEPGVTGDLLFHLQDVVKNSIFNKENDTYHYIINFLRQHYIEDSPTIHNLIRWAVDANNFPVIQEIILEEPDPEIRRARSRIVLEFLD